MGISAQSKQTKNQKSQKAIYDVLLYSASHDMRTVHLQDILLLYPHRQSKGCVHRVHHTRPEQSSPAANHARSVDAAQQQDERLVRSSLPVEQTKTNVECCSFCAVVVYRVHQTRKGSPTATHTRSPLSHDHHALGRSHHRQRLGQGRSAEHPRKNRRHSYPRDHFAALVACCCCLFCCCSCDCCVLLREACRKRCIDVATARA